jgi:hypothetical protein
MDSVTSAAMLDMTNFEKVLPVLRRLKLENTSGPLEGGSNDAMIQSTRMANTVTSTALQQKEALL